MNIFVTFSNDVYAISREYAGKMAKKKGKFDKVVILSPKDIDRKFYTEHSKILKTKYGAGLWLWKPYSVNKVLNEIANVGDYVFYADAASFFIRDCHYIIDVMKDKEEDIFVCDNPTIEKQFTKEQTFIGMGCTDDRFRNTNQRHGSFMCFKKTKRSVAFVEEWLKCCCNYNLIYMDNTDPSINNCEDFIAHREDQSILSLLSKKYNIKSHYDPSQYGLLPDWYAVPNAIYMPPHYPKEYPVCLILHKTKDVNKKVILNIICYLLMPKFLRSIISYIKLRKLKVRRTL